MADIAAAPPQNSYVGPIRRNAGTIIAIAAVLMLLATIFAASYVVGEDLAYSWDQVTYWETYWHYGETFRTSIGQWAQELAASVWSDDYNPVAVALLMPINALFGRLRGPFIAGLASIYLVPTIIVGAYLAQLLTQRVRGSLVAPIVFFSALGFLFTPFWAPVLRGYPDIAGLLPFAIAALVVARSDFARKFDLKTVILLGVLLWLPFLFRRWFAFSIAVLYLTAAVYSLNQVLSVVSSDRGKAFVRVVATYVLAGAISAGLAFALQGGLVLRVLGSNYAELYEAYQGEPVEHFTRFYEHFGVVPIVLALLGAFFGLRSSNSRPLTLFMIANLVLYLGLMASVQLPGIHHYLPAALWMFALGATGTYQLIGGLAQPIARAVSASVLVLVAAVLFLGTFFPIGASGPIALLFPQMKAYQLTLSDPDEYSRLIATLDGLGSQSDRITVLASSFSVSDSLLQGMASDQLKKRFAPTSQIDQRDGFRADALLTRYVVVADPIQLHVPKDQHVIAVPATQVMSGQGIGAAYRQLPEEFNLSTGVRIRIFEKTRPFTEQEVDALFEEFYQSYPGWRQTYDGSLAERTLASSYVLGDLWGNLSTAEPNTLFLHPGENIATEVSLPWGVVAWSKPKFINLQIDPTARTHCPDADGVDVLIGADDAEFWNSVVPPDGQAVRIDLQALSSQRLSLKVSKRSQPDCDWLYVRFSNE